MLLESYLFSLAAGGVVLLVSIIAGGGDSDMSSDADVDAEADVDFGLDGGFDKDFELDKDFGFDKDLGKLDLEDVDGGLWLPFLSLRFWTFGLVCYGLTGLLLHFFENSLGFPVALTTGISLGWIISYAFHRLKKSSISSATSLQQNSGQEGKVLIAIEKGKMGKIRIKQGGQLVDVPAQTNDDERIESGEQVLILRVENGVAMVSHLEQLQKNLKKRNMEKQVDKDIGGS